MSVEVWVPGQGQTEVFAKAQGAPNLQAPNSIVCPSPVPPRKRLDAPTPQPLPLPPSMPKLRHVVGKHQAQAPPPPKAMLAPYEFWPMTAPPEATTTIPLNYDGFQGSTIGPRAPGPAFLSPLPPGSTQAVSASKVAPPWRTGSSKIGTVVNPVIGAAPVCISQKGVSKCVIQAPL